jgi:hypothetical protein
MVLALAVLTAPVPAEETSPAPLLEALAFVPVGSEPAGLDFIDWAQLNKLHGGAGITGASPLAERQRLMLDIAHAEAATMPLGFDRLAAWPEAWGWSNADLEWEARVYGTFAVMRFGEHLDPARFGQALQGFGYEPSPFDGGLLYRPDPQADVPWQLRFANMHGLDIHGQAITEPMVWVALSDDGQTAIFSRSSDAGQLLQAGLMARPGAVAAGGYGRAAAALGRPLAASIISGSEACSERTMGWLEGEAREMAAAVAPLHRYEALAAGYTRDHAAAPPEGRFVFAYPHAKQARDDLAGRRTLVEEGNPLNDNFSRYADVAFGLADARVSGSRLILDVVPVEDAAVHVMRQMGITPILFATCGQLPGTVAA